MTKNCFYDARCELEDVIHCKMRSVTENKPENAVKGLLLRI